MKFGSFFPQTHSKTSARNFIRIYSDIAFLSHIVYRVTIFPGHSVVCLIKYLILHGESTAFKNTALSI